MRRTRCPEGLGGTEGPDVALGGVATSGHVVPGPIINWDLGSPLLNHRTDGENSDC
jgi:hypothetical protein